ncbi:MAG: carboxypeptidase-like regulatory domain-containing protein [Acidobacteriota bacterium]|nr:carboxypeptidase-like regulatory domain-containing protein [Acidobacteriota bacterium]
MSFLRGVFMVHLLMRSSLLAFALLSLTSGARAQVTSQTEPSPGSISGRVTIGGKPAPRVFVVLEPFEHNATNARLPRTITDEEGVYALLRVPEGRYTVKPVAPSFIIAEGPGAERAGSRLHSSLGLEGFIVTVARGDMIERIDFDLVPGGVITGRVTDAGGRPVIAAPVYCLRLNERGSSDGASSKSSDTDDRGIYRIYGLPAGSYLISVSGVGSTARRYPRMFHPATTEQARAVPVEVTAGGEASRVDVQLSQPEQSHVIRGRVVDDVTGQPVPDVFINVRSSERSGSGLDSYMMTRAEGTFEIVGPPGNYKIEISTTGPPNKGYYSDPVTIEMNDADVTEVEIKAIRGASISGVIVIEGGNNSSLVNSLSNISLSAMRVLPPEAMNGLSASMIFSGARISPSGKFEFTGLRPGRMKLQPENFPPSFAFMRIERNGMTITDALDLSPGERITDVRIVVAYGTGSIRGQAKVGGGTPPAKMGWILKVRRDDGEEILTQILDARGQFWVRGLAPGTYEVTATIDYVEIPGVTPSPHPAPVKQKVSVEKGKESQVVFTVDLGTDNKK